MEMMNIRVIMFFLLVTVGAVCPARAQTGLIFPPQDEHTHGSSLVRLSNGELASIR